ncbi:MULTISPECIES: hypothetical protein [Clostridium]|uniref:Phage tail tube protein n=1 Tax=Clostridium frigoriphilum TaxID=443253 RepID=A0ABU7UU35_9CLOT|nr:hypothetical protein [Clostridium sp. DSM 17811]MBU3098748.1 hypothetical protein [Clostridium sp. DSM 17811]
MADIYVCTENRDQVYQFPTLPDKFPDLESNSLNEEFQTFNNGVFNLLNGTGLISFDMGFMLAMQQYVFCKCDYMNTPNIINLMDSAKTDKFPIRLIFKGNDNADYINILVSVEKLTWGFNHEMDVDFNASFKEYRALK